MPELQDLMDTGALDNFELDSSYVPTEDYDVMTKVGTENLVDNLQNQIDNITVDGGSF